MEKERKITAPAGCEIEKAELVDGVAVVTFREKERKLPNSWEEFCEMYPVKHEEFFINEHSQLEKVSNIVRDSIYDRNIITDRATAEAVLALCQLVQLRNVYNGDWVPEWSDGSEIKYCIDFAYGDICPDTNCVSPSLLYFKTKELRDEFLKYFRDLIEKLKPLYGIKEGGEE